MFNLATKCPDVTVGTVLLAQKWSRNQEAASEGSSDLVYIFMLKALGIVGDHIVLVTGVGTTRTWVHILLVTGVGTTRTWDHILLVTGVGTTRTWVHIVLVAALENTWGNIPLLPAVGTAWGHFSPSFCSFICTVLSNTISVTQCRLSTFRNQHFYISQNIFANVFIVLSCGNILPQQIKTAFRITYGVVSLIK
jgi:hypothetical protein